MKTTSGEQLLTVNEAAELLGVAENTVRAWGAKGKILEYRHPMNNYRVYKRKELEAVRRQIESPDLRD